MDIQEAAKVIRVCNTDDLLRFIDQDPERRDLLESSFSSQVNPDGPHTILPLNSFREKLACLVFIRMDEAPPVFKMELVIPAADIQRLDLPPPAALDMAIWAVTLEEQIAQESNHPNHE